MDTNNFIAGSGAWKACLEQLGLNKPCRFNKVRWYSTVKAIGTVLDIKNVILDRILHVMPMPLQQQVSTLDWELLKEIFEVLKPINKLIGILETKNTSLAIAVREILKYAKDLFSGSDSEAKVSARRAFLLYMDPQSRYGIDDISLYLAAYLLDRRNKMAFITDGGILHALCAISRIAIKSSKANDIDPNEMTTTIVNEFKCYKESRGEYASFDAQSQENDQKTWWKNRLCCGTMARVGLKLAHLKSSSSNIERTFSSIKTIQGTSRLNMKADTLKKLSQLKVAGKDILDEVDLERLDEEALKYYKKNTDHDDEPGENDLNNSDSSLLDTSENYEGYPDWLDQFDEEAKKSYYRFFKYIDFSVSCINTNTTPRKISEITDFQILTGVARALSCNESQNIMEETIIGDIENSDSM